MKRLSALALLMLVAEMSFGTGTNVLPEKVPLTINYTNYVIQFPTGTAQRALFLATNDIATASALAAKPSGMVNPWTNNCNGGGYALSNTTLTTFSLVDTNNMGTNAVTGSIKWSPRAATMVTNVQFGGNSYTQAVNIQAGTGMGIRVVGAINYFDCNIVTNVLVNRDDTNGWTVSSHSTFVTASITNGYATTDYVNASTNDCITNVFAGANATVVRTGNYVVVESAVGPSITNDCVTQLVAGANITLGQTGQYVVVSAAASPGFLQAMNTNYFPIVFSYSGLSLSSTNGMLWCKNTSGRTWTITNISWRCAGGEPMGCVATQGAASAISVWDGVIEEMMVFGTTPSNKAVNYTVNSGDAVSGFITNSAGTNTEFTLSVHD